MCPRLKMFVIFRSIPYTTSNIGEGRFGGGRGRNSVPSSTSRPAAPDHRWPSGRSLRRYVHLQRQGCGPRPAGKITGTIGGVERSTTIPCRKCRWTATMIQESWVNGGDNTRGSRPTGGLMGSRVVLAMSGGVDSSVAAYLLQGAGVRGHRSVHAHRCDRRGRRAPGQDLLQRQPTPSTPRTSPTGSTSRFTPSISSATSRGSWTSSPTSTPPAGRRTRA